MSHKVIVPIGPYHPLQEEPEFFRLFVEGEKVVDIDIIIGYNHRGIEELAEDKHYDQVTFLVERICGICSTSHPFAYVLACEDLAGVEVPERAHYIRMVIDELQRIHSHLLWLGLAGHFIGYNTVWMWAWRYREPVLDLFELITGNRNNYAMMKIGGIRRDMHEEDFPAIRKALDEVSKALDMFKGAIMDDPVIGARLKGVGILTRQDVKEFACVGPTARASGVAIDVRKDDPYALYNNVDWKVIVQDKGDVFAKAVCRVLEMYESVSIIKQCLKKMKPGSIDANVTDMPVGEGIGRVEAPRGECFHYVRSDGTNRPVRHKVRAPSFANVASNKKSCKGGTISDAALTLAAVDPCYCCTERTAVIDVSNKKKLMNGWDLVKLSQEKTHRMLHEMGKGH